MKMNSLTLGVILALVPVGIGANESEEPASAAKSYTAHPTESSHHVLSFETIEVLADKVAVKSGDELVTTVGSGRRLGVVRIAGDLLEVQVIVSGEVRCGWIKQTDAKFLQNEDVNLAAEWVQIAKQLKPDLDANACRQRLQVLIEELAVSASAGQTAAERCRLVGTQLFQKENFRFVRETRFFSLDSFLEEKQGNCLSLSLAYICVAQKIKMPLYLVLAPDHAFVRHEGGNDSFNIETTQMGRLYPTDEYLREFLGDSKFRLVGGVHLKNVPYPRVLGVFMHQLGCALRDQGNNDLAIQKFQTATETDPEFAEPYYSWGKILASVEKDADACDKYRLATERNKNDAVAYFDWGASLSHLRRYEEACYTFRRSVEIDPQNILVYVNWAGALSGLGKYAEACQMSERALKLDPGFWPGIFNYGLQLSKMGKTAEARRKLEEALDLAPEGMKPMIRQRITALPTD
jgi:tetratricopeptide (TPR) repeat protein